MAGKTPRGWTAAREQADRANDIRRLAVAANGHSVTRQERERAETALVQRLGRRGAAKAKEAELRSAGARPKGLGRWFG
jgi:hypothetical protein